jgi:lipopolysaccharide assembly outer membrane protein LptD (OstA)
VKFARKLKYKVFKSRGVTIRGGLILIAFCFLFCNFQAKGQDPDPEQVFPVDSLQISSADLDSLAAALADTIPELLNDSIQRVLADTLKRSEVEIPDSLFRSIPSVLDSLVSDTTEVAEVVPVGDIATTVNYSSSDSINFNVRDKIVQLYGSSKIDYDPIGLEAERIDIDWNTNVIGAVGIKDSLGNDVGLPVFKNGMETYETNNIKYNFKTEKAIISGLVTQQGEGIIHGDEVFKNSEDELFIPYTKYTTCNLAHPHFYISARNVKAIPDNKMVSGPFNMVVNDVPTPLGFFFGMFPEQSHKASGILVPSYGEQKLKGFYLENGGYYFAISDYMNLALTGSIYSKGGYGVNIRSQYISRYRYSGNLTFNFTKQNLTQDGEAEVNFAKDFRLAWSHAPKSKGTGRFSANVNAATSSYNQNNVLQDINEQVKTTLSSSVNYTKSFRGTPITAGLNARFNQNLKTRKVDLLLPEFSASIRNIYPFQSRTGGSNSWLDRLTFRYTLNGLNKITNQVSRDSIAPFDLETIPKLIENAQNGMKHTIPLGTSLKAMKHFTISPSVNYEELWYSSQLNYTYDSLTNTVITDTIPGFQRVYSYGTSVGMNTRIYGTYFFNRETGIQAIRHVINPSISYGYRPDFSDPKYDYYQEVQINEDGDTALRSRYQGYVYGTPGRGESSSLGLSLTNTLEMKVKSKKDTTNTSEKIPLLRNFGLSGSYNFAADSFRLSNISARATTSLLNNKKVFKESATLKTTSVNLNGTIDPYVWVLDSVSENSAGDLTYHQRKIDKYAWNNGDGLGQFMNVNVSIRSGISANPTKKSGGSGSTSINPNEINRMQDMLNSGTLSYHEEAIIQSLLDYPELYVDFNVAWSLNFTYSLNYRKRGFDEGDVTQTLQFNGDLSLTPKWKLTYTTGYDITKKEWTQTRMGLHRDMHCWELNFSWVPFGRFTSYDFTIRAKSALLQDLKVNRRRTFQDNIF